MDILGQIRQEASQIANSHSIEIIEAAQKNLTQTRFKRLRKRTAVARTPEELAYLHALNRYVDIKLTIRKISNRNVNMGKSYEESVSHFQGVREMEYWRAEMDRIEYGLTRGHIIIHNAELAEYTV